MRVDPQDAENRPIWGLIMTQKRPLSRGPQKTQKKGLREMVNGSSTINVDALIGCVSSVALRDEFRGDPKDHLQTSLYDPELKTG